jgi:hypothetical protein
MGMYRYGRTPHGYLYKYTTVIPKEYDYAHGEHVILSRRDTALEFLSIEDVYK